VRSAGVLLARSLEVAKFCCGGLAPWVSGPYVEGESEQQRPHPGLGPAGSWAKPLLATVRPRARC